MRFVYHDYQPIAIYIFINRLFCSLHFWKFTDTFADIIDVFLRKIAFAVKVGIYFHLTCRSFEDQELFEENGDALLRIPCNITSH